MAYAHSEVVVATPIGFITVSADGEILTGVMIPSGQQSPQSADAPLLREARRQIEAYFNGGLQNFDLPLAPAPSPRGPALRQAIRSLGFGETLGYGALARQFGSSARAVGQACARNPFPLIVPCHRVLASGGRLGAYSGGDGPTTKAWLLTHEQAKDWRE